MPEKLILFFIWLLVAPLGVSALILLALIMIVTWPFRWVLKKLGLMPILPPPPKTIGIRYL